MGERGRKNPFFGIANHEEQGNTRKSLPIQAVPKRQESCKLIHTCITTFELDGLCSPSLMLANTATRAARSASDHDLPLLAILLADPCVRVGR